MTIPLNEIFYFFVLPSWKPIEVTAFQGFAPGLMELAPLLPLPIRLPADIFELGMPPADRLARRRSGEGGYVWTPLNIENLHRRRPTPAQPFTVVFTADTKVAKRVAEWRRNLRIRPLHVSSARKSGAIAPTDLTVDRLQAHCRAALRQAKEWDAQLMDEDALKALAAWQCLAERPSSLRYCRHNVTAPNEMVLITSGEAQNVRDEGHLKLSPHQHYVDGITESARAVLALHEQTTDRLASLVHPPFPDLTLFAPTTYRGIVELMRRHAPTPAVFRAARALERQRGYTIDVALNSEAEINQIGPFMSLRGAELKTQSLALGLRTASTLAATVRLPPKVDRTAGVVGQLARHLRRYDDAPPDRKTAKVFRTVQDALVDAIPAEHLQIIRESKTGIKIVGNAPLEWLPIDGVPLGVHTDVSRIPVTPGNIFMEQLRSIPPLHIPSEAFKQYLVLSMFEEGDHIAHYVRRSLEVLPGAERNSLTGTEAQPRTIDEFVAAMNAFDGPILIVDGHGSHPEDSDIGGLIIGGKPVDVWTLRNQIKVPPIVILSACDTHPLDRSHASVANGFLACGATAVLATVLPIRARDAAVFLVRLMLRAIQYGSAVNGMGRAVPWTNIVGGALRMQLASDIMRGLAQRGVITADKGRELQLLANSDLNPHRPDWFPRLAQRCQEAGGLDKTKWEAVYNDILAASDVIRYVHLGNPEYISIADQRVFERMAHHMKLSEPEGA